MPSPRATASTTYRINLASFGTPLKGSWVFGEWFLANVNPQLPFPNDLSLLCFGTGAFLRITAHLTCRCTVSAALVYSI